MDDKQRNHLRAMKRKILFLVVALDAQLTTPEDIVDSPQSLLPLILKFQIRLAPALQQVLKQQQQQQPLSVSLSNTLFSNEDPEYGRIIIYCMSKLFEWAIANFKFELIVLQSRAIQFCHYISFLLGGPGSIETVKIKDVPTSSTFRSSFLLHLIPQFVGLFHIHPQYGEGIIIDGLKHLAEINLIGPTFIDLFIVMPELANPTEELLYALLKNNESTIPTTKKKTTHELRVEMQHFHHSLIECRKIIQMLMTIGGFYLQCVIDRLLIILGNDLLAIGNDHSLIISHSIGTSSSTDPSAISSSSLDLALNGVSPIPLPIVNSLGLPGRTADPLEIHQWTNTGTYPIPNDLLVPLTTESTAASPQRLIDLVSENALILIVQRFLPIIVCGRFDPHIQSKCQLLAQLLSPTSQSSLPELYGAVVISITPMSAAVIHKVGQPVLNVGTPSDIAVATHLSEWMEFGKSELRVGLVEALSVTAEVLMDLVAYQFDIECLINPEIRAQSICHRDPLMGPPVYWTRWYGIMGMMITAVENIGKQLIEVRRSAWS